jgi:hypothetical protein
MAKAPAHFCIRHFVFFIKFWSVLVTYNFWFRQNMLGHPAGDKKKRMDNNSNVEPGNGSRVRETTTTALHFVRFRLILCRTPAHPSATGTQIARQGQRQPARWA